MGFGFFRILTDSINETNNLDKHNLITNIDTQVFPSMNMFTLHNKICCITKR